MGGGGRGGGGHAVRATLPAIVSKIKKKVIVWLHGSNR